MRKVGRAAMTQREADAIVEKRFGQGTTIGFGRSHTPGKPPCTSAVIWTPPTEAAPRGEILAIGVGDSVVDAFRSAYEKAEERRPRP